MHSQWSKGVFCHKASQTIGLQSWPHAWEEKLTYWYPASLFWLKGCHILPANDLCNREHCGILIPLFSSVMMSTTDAECVHACQQYATQLFTVLHTLCGCGGGTVNCSPYVYDRFHSLWNTTHMSNLSRFGRCTKLKTQRDFVRFFCLPRAQLKQWKSSAHTPSKCCTLNTALVSPVSYNHTVSVLCGCRVCRAARGHASVDDLLFSVLNLERSSSESLVLLPWPWSNADNTVICQYTYWRSNNCLKYRKMNEIYRNFIFCCCQSYFTGVSTLYLKWLKRREGMMEWGRWEEWGKIKKKVVTAVYHPLLSTQVRRPWGGKRQHLFLLTIPLLLTAFDFLLSYSSGFCA